MRLKPDKDRAKISTKIFFVKICDIVTVKKCIKGVKGKCLQRMIVDRDFPINLYLICYIFTQNINEACLS